MIIIYSQNIIFLYIFRGLSAHLQEDTIVHMQHMVLSLSTRVTVPYAACIQLYPPEDEHLRLETCRGIYYFMNK
jgi:hypothetical protein